MHALAARNLEYARLQLFIISEERTIEGKRREDE